MAQTSTKQPAKQRPVLSQNDFNTVIASVTPRFSEIAKRTSTNVQLNAEAHFAKTKMFENRLLLECSKESITDAFLSIASIGLSLNPVFQHAALIPIWDKDSASYDCALWVMYRGMMKLATDAGIITSLSVDNVYAMDAFSLERTETGDKMTHKLNFQHKRGTDQNAYIGTYCLAHLAGDVNHSMVEFISADEMDTIMKQSKNYDPEKPGCVWIKFQDEMRKKAAIKRAQKRWPARKMDSVAYQRFAMAVDNDNRQDVIEGTVTSRTETSSPIPPEPVITAEQAKQIRDLSKEAKLREEKLCEVYFVEKVEQLLAKDFDSVIERLAERIKIVKDKEAEKKPPEASDKEAAKEREPGEDDEG